METEADRLSTAPEPKVTKEHSMETLGARYTGEGVNFALYSQSATAVELCLFDSAGVEVSRHNLPHCDEGRWHGFLPGCQVGQHYGYRVHGDYKPEDGLWHNANKLLVDPYARLLSGPLTWDPAVFGYEPLENNSDQKTIDTRDSAAFIPKGIVHHAEPNLIGERAAIPWQHTLLYELNVRGYTMQHEAVSEKDRGRFRGLSTPEILKYIKTLGVTSIELLPCHSFVDEHFLAKKGLRNYWGYNSLNFFSPEVRYSDRDGVAEFRHMANAIHDAGLELILDVVFNHTGEGDDLGPTLSFRGIDNHTYYRTLPDRPGVYINDTGCGNTINIDHAQTQILVCDSLRYWVETMGVDGFRFDLAPILGRTSQGYTRSHAFFKRLEKDPVLSRVKLIAEPWDVGPGGYQVGQFPAGWSEWNDKFRDTTRSFWRGDNNQGADFARRIHGSADIFDHSDRKPSASVNFVTSHDGFTLNDCVSYLHRHNQANGENNADGHAHNLSQNFGIEGPTDDRKINARRRRQRLNMLASLFLSRGTPMLLAGDEFGNSQLGNNNAYAQDNSIGWIDWSGLTTDPGFYQQVRALISLRKNTDLLHSDSFVHGLQQDDHGQSNIEWLSAMGETMTERDWHHYKAFCMLLRDVEAKTDTDADGSHTSEQAVTDTSGHEEQPKCVALCFNAAGGTVDFHLPDSKRSGSWRLAFSSDDSCAIENRHVKLVTQSCVVLFYGD